LKLLATTALEETWGHDEDIVFLGEWCILLDRKSIWEQRNFSVVENHWDDRIKLSQDHAYLSIIHNKLLIELSGKLNVIFNLNFSTRAWQIILDPWLLTHISVIWDRWESINKLSSEVKYKTISLKYNKSSTNIFDYNNYIENILKHEWNHIEFIRIIKHSFCDKFEIINSNKEVRICKKSTKSNFISTHLVLKIFDYFSFLIKKNNKYLFFTSYFSVFNLFKLNLKLRQLPKFYYNIFKWPNNDLFQNNFIINKELRNSLKISLTSTNLYESYLYKYIFNDIPIIYLEGFPELLRSVEKINLNPDVIFSANAHWDNEIFKTWTAMMIMKGKKFITMEHGGGIHQTMNCMNFEEDIADYRTMWVNPYHSKHIKLPPNKILPKIKSTKKYLSIIGFENTIYNYRVEASPKGSQIKDHTEIIFKLYSKIDLKIKQFLKIHPYKNLGYNTRELYINELGNNKISTNRNLVSFFKEAKILVCTYPQTTFTEAMFSDLPVILIYPTKLWETIKEMDELIIKLKNSNILFDNVNLAAEHINSIWEDPYLWWNSNDVKSTRNYYNQHIMSDDENWLVKWTTFIERLEN
jgi:putative transferase (TIGR04331 family)